MPNFYSDNSDILFHFNNMNISEIINLKEDNFSEKDDFLHAPQNEADAMDNYNKVLEVVGNIASGFIAPRAANVDRDGIVFENGEVIFPENILDSFEKTKQADLTGFSIPRKYGGIQIPITVYIMAVEMISRADASFMNIFGLQGISDTILKFGSEEQKLKYLPLFASGSVMGSMALTEPDAGSDLQAAMLKASLKDDNTWELSGVKRFITNGCAEISLVMARSEKGHIGGRGLSLFIYRRDDKMKIRRIEHKLGIHGSPTCELQFNNAPAELLGKRKLGLIKYTMHLMNLARLAVAAQALGIAEAAYRESLSYAKKRVQFKKPIYEFSAIFEMLTLMKVNIEASRTLLYEASRCVDIKDGLENKIEKYPEKKKDLQKKLKKYAKYSALLTPFVKSYIAEMSNKICYDAIQIHAGVGYTCEFAVERLYRDARITSIYEGTTQLQILAAIGGVTDGTLLEIINSYENNHDFNNVSELIAGARYIRSQLELSINYIKEKKDIKYQEYHSARLVLLGTETMISYLMTIDALKSEAKKKTAALFISTAKNQAESITRFILSNDQNLLNYYNDILNDNP